MPAPWLHRQQRNDGEEGPTKWMVTEMPAEPASWFRQSLCWQRNGSRGMRPGWTDQLDANGELR